MMQKEEILFPKTTRIKETITDIGPKKARQIYNVQDLVEYINDAFLQEYRSYLDTNSFFPGCPLSVYEQHYDQRFQEYLRTYPDADEFDFLKDEYSLVYKLAFHLDDVYLFSPHLNSDPHHKNFRLSTTKTRDYIHDRLIRLGHFFEMPGNFDIYYEADTPEWIKERDKWLYQPIRNKDLPVHAPTTNAEEDPVTNRTREISLSALETAYLAHYLVESKSYSFINGTPGELDWKYFSEVTNGASSTNIRKFYSEIMRPDKRLKNSRQGKIKRIISYLGTHFPEHEQAIQLAEQELQIVVQKPY